MAWVAGIMAAIAAYSAFSSAEASVLCGVGAAFAVVLWSGLNDARTKAQSLSQRVLGDLEAQATLIQRLELRIRTLERGPPSAEVVDTSPTRVAVPASMPVDELPVDEPALDSTSEPVEWAGLAVPQVASAPGVANLPPVEEPTPRGVEPTPQGVETPPRSYAPWQPAQPDPIELAFARVRDWLFGGNTVARMGVLVLVVGVALLVKYAADHDYFPLELRLAFAASIGMALAVVGFRTREKRRDFSLVLQGGGIASTYLVVFFAYRTYGLLPASLTFSLLLVLGATHVVLAVLQNAESLALMGMLGGFLAPILASKGGGSHIALFSYYALLNGGILATAWFRPFRWLNLLGFTCTFGVATAWGALRYEPEHALSAGCFLALYFVYYSLTGVLFTWRQPAEKRGLIDSTITFGTPLATFSLMLGLMRPYPYGVAFGSLALGGYYTVLARILWTRAPEVLRAQVEAFIALGVCFVTLAIPYALDDHNITGMAWALESAGVFWIGARQQRLRTRLGAYLLFCLSIGAVIVTSGGHGGVSGLLARVVLALVAWAFSVLAYHYAEELGAAERAGAQQVWVVGLGAWLLALHAGLARYVPDLLQKAAALGWVAVSACMLELANTTLRWKPGRWMAYALAPAIFFWLVPGSITQHPFEHYTWAAFAAALVVALWVGHRADRRTDDPSAQDSHELGSAAALYYAVLVWIAAVLCVWESDYATSLVAPTPVTWRRAACLFAAVVFSWAVHARIARERWPFEGRAGRHRMLAIGPVAVCTFVYALVLTLESAGSIAPLTFIPILNPLDLSSALGILFTVRLAWTHWEGELPPLFKRALGLVVVVWLTTVLVRALCNWQGVAYELDAVLASSLIQSALSIFWALLGLASMLVASRRASRAVWMGGAGLLGWWWLSCLSRIFRR